MAKSGNKGSGKRRKISQKAANNNKKRQDDASDSEENEQIGEEMTSAQEAAFRNKMRLQAQTVAKTVTVSEAMANAVKKCTKKDLWKVCKFIKNDDFLRKGANFVMQKLELSDLDGIPVKERIKREEIWKEVHGPIIRETLNKHRNYVSGEIQKVVYEALKSDQDDLLPNKKEVRLLMLRDCLDEETEAEVREDMENKFVTYVNDLLPKVAGNKYWGPSTRHYYLPSSYKHDIVVPEGSELDSTVDAVSASDEAFLALVFDNSYDKWKKQAEKYKKSVLDKQKDASVELFVPKADKTDYNLPYTNAKSGNLKYGGWKVEGIKKFDAYKDKIELNRRDNEEYCRVVEEDNLVRIQKKEGILQDDEKDAKTKKPKGKSNAAFAEEDAGEENDFASW